MRRIISHRAREKRRHISYPHVLQPVSAVLYRAVLLQRGAHLGINGLLLLVQIVHHFIQSGHQLTALQLLLICDSGART